MTAREFTGTLALCAAVAGVTVALALGTPRPPRQPAPVFTPTAFCPSGQHVVKIRDGMPVCATAEKRAPFDFYPWRSS
jgi:hypothetical protein